MLEPAVELHLGKIRRRLAQDLVRLAQFAVLALEHLDALALVCYRTTPDALVTLGLPHPVAQCLARAADLLGNRVDRRPLRGVLCLVVQDHPNRAGTDLGGIRGTRFVIAPSSQELEPPGNPVRFTDWLRRQIEAAAAAPNNPPMSHWRWEPCFSSVLYRARNRIERFFNRIEHFRRLATRYEKHAINFLAVLKLADSGESRPRIRDDLATIPI
jgi:hypothetical protein